MAPPPSSITAGEAPITALDVPASAPGVLLVGGTFDPPHRAHAQMAEAARQWLDGRGGERGGRGGTHVLFVPAARSPFKPAPAAADADRIAMVRAMASEMGESGGAGVWTDEIDRARPGQASFWVDTLRRAHAGLAARPGREPPPRLSFLIGADQAIALHRWKEARRILELARPVIVARAPITTGDLLGRALRDTGWWGQGEVTYLASRVAPCDLSDLSATAIRAGLAQGQVGVQAGLHAQVLRVIQERGLYAG